MCCAGADHPPLGAHSVHVPTVLRMLCWLQEMTGKEVEYVSLSRDTTESDLKQRREITSGTALHVDQVRYREIPSF